MSSTKKNIVLQSTYQIASLIIPFITAPYVTRVLQAEQIGIYSYTYSIVNYFMIFAMLGIDYYGNRTIAKVRGNQETVNKLFTEVFYSHLIPSFLALTIYIVFCFQMTGIYRIIAFIQILYVMGEMLNVNWLFAGLAVFKVTVYRNMIIKILTIILIFVFVRTKDDLLLYISIMAIGTFLSLTIVWVVIRKYVKFVRVNLREVLGHLKPMSVLFVAAVATNIYRMIDKTMLGSLGHLQILGSYEYADKFLRLPLSVIVAVGSVMLSKSANMISVDGEDKVINLLKKTLNYITLLVSIMTFGVILYGRDFSVLFLGNEFSDTGVLLGVLAISFLFMTWNSVLRTQYFIPKSLDNYYVISVWIGAIVNVILNLVLIPHYHGIGAAIATDISYFCVTVCQLFFIRKEIKIIGLLKESLPSLCIGLVPCMVMIPVHNFVSVSWLSFLIQVGLFCVIFVLTTVVFWKITNNPMIHYITKRVNRCKRIM
jgi:O-antigen/teichoic acid export membrane protein